jgi:acetyl-CoA synthetase
MTEKNLEALLSEQRTFPPPPEFVAKANLKDPWIYAEAERDPDAFWAKCALQLDWFKPWDKVCEWEAPFHKWFLGGKLNASYNCLDRHLKTWRRNKAALIWEGEPGERRTFTYGDLHREVCQFANVLKKLGVKRGDRVTLYLPLIPELAVAMLACARIGAAHTVVFGGFSPESLRGRINDAEAKVVVTADGGYRRGQIVRLKSNTDAALAEGGGCPSVESVVIVRRVGEAATLHVKEGRDHWYHRLMEEASYVCEPEHMDAEDLMFTLYTSGTTASPKGIAHTTGGYMTGAINSVQWVFDPKDEDIYWCTADIGWITGHTYVVYGPMSNGMTVFMYEGSPDWPERDRFWAMIEKYKINVLYTAPTAIRAFMGWGAEHPKKHDLSSLRLLGTVGEPINPEAWMWYHEHIGYERCPIVDTWWQTETGMIMISPIPSLTTTKPGSACRGLPGVFAAVVDGDGNPVGPGGGGYLVLTRPVPSMFRTIFRDPERYVKTYFSRLGPDVYFTGDGAKLDADGYLWLMGRVDDVMNVSGHRLSTIEVESALVDHPDVAEAAVIGKDHSVKGQAIAAFVTLRVGSVGSHEKIAELKQHVTDKIGALARPEEIYFTAELPKTRSGKIMRRLLRDIAEGRAMGDTSTLADPSVVAKLRGQYEEKGE